MIAGHWSRWGVLTFLALLALVSEAHACHWRHCRCGHLHSSGYAYGDPGQMPLGSPAGAPAAPAAAPASWAPVYAAPAYYYSAPVYSAPVAQWPTALGAPAQWPSQQPAAAPQQAIVPAIGEALAVLRLLRQFQDEVGPLVPRPRKQEEEEDKTEDPSLQRVSAALDRLENGQADLRGRIINNAGIGRSLGEKLVLLEERIASIEKATGPQGDIIRHLTELTADVRALGGQNRQPAAVPEVDPPVVVPGSARSNRTTRVPEGGAAATASVPLEQQVAKLQQQVEALQTTTQRLDKMEQLLSEIHQKLLPPSE